jgi:alkanesulfonate monooxygenase SsuD/methylene tetrahydromethanopterin reductase-like flavin-dependent oxidoreductase (luciferase family)
VQFHLYLPQMRLSPDAVVVRARAAEANGFDGIALMDHLAPPLAESQALWEAMTLATWLAAHTDRLAIGHLVLCDAFRHPAQLSREALTIDHVSGGRFELGLGSGSVPAEFRRFGIDAGDAAARVERLGETLEVLRLLWTGEVVHHPGPRFPLDGAQQLPVPVAGRVPIVLGGTAPRLLDLVREYADWWSVPPGQLHRLEELRPLAGDRARVSMLEMFTLLPRIGADEIEARARRRFGHLGDTHVIADAAGLRRHVQELRDRGVDRVYAWFSDFADPAGLEAFGNDVIAGLTG